ncbi:MAG: hypothetical protein ACREP1_01225 [Rhodanobacteraceae bacterium]
MNATVIRAAMFFAALSCAGGVFGAEPETEKGGKMSLADGRFELTVPDKWEKKRPKVNIIEHEYEAPASTGDARSSRLTVMGAGGSVEDNVQRWYGQFRQPDDSETANTAKVERKKVAGQNVTLVDVSGTYIDRPGGPFAGGAAVDRENYRMLAAIIETAHKGKRTGNYFIKLIGPRQTVADNKQAFEKMIESLKER